MKKLTKRQEQILEFIRLYLGKYGYPPTRREIADGFGFNSANSAEQHLRLIAAKGFLRITNGVSRGIALAK